MNNVLELAILLYFQYAFVQCLIPNLSVRRVDKATIAKKRQDTLEICRIFNEEATQDNHIYSPINIVKSYTHQRHGRNRLKRSALKYAVNPALNEDDEQRVEEIVDKLYDDVDDVEKTKYHKEKKKAQPKQPSRRFDFAPQLILGPNDVSKPPSTTEDKPVYISKARWKLGIIPYFIDPKTYDAELSERIMKAFDYVEKATCIRLQRIREKPVDEASMRKVNWVYITNPSGIRQCVHSNEKKKLDGVQMTVLGYDCMSQGDIVHEVMHILGYSHEHLRSDRDQHVSVLWDNIKPGYRKYFDISSIPENLYNLETLPYDYASIMHYPPRAFSKNGQITIMTEQGVKIGQREGLSEIDLEKVGLIYSAECVERNRQYLQKTCPSVVKADIKPANISHDTIEEYFRDRLWPFGIVPYKFRDNMEFSAEERENMRAVFRHIEKETCIRFKDVAADENEEEPAGNHWNQVKAGYAKLKDEKKEDNSTDNKLKHNPSGANNNTKLNDNPNINSVTEGKEVLSTDNNDIAPNFVVEDESATNTTKKRRSRLRGKEFNIDSFLKIGKDKIKSVEKNIKKKLIYQRPTRRHAAATIILSRSAEPGCKCPDPGKPKGDAVLEVNADCFNSVNDLLHYFVHILGLDHQHNMHDRDSYLYIIWNNLPDDLKKDLKNKLPPAASAGFSYDYQSVMHYPWLEIKNGKTNIMYPIWNDGWSMGHWQGLSSTDVQKLNLLYFNQCSQRTKEESSKKTKLVK